MSANLVKAAAENIRINLVSKYPASGLVGGAGLFYALDNSKYHHLPLVFICPNAYAGYQILKNKDYIKQYFTK